MEVEIKSPTEIILKPESKLEENIVRGGCWTATTREPQPFEVNKTDIVLTKKPS